MERSAVIPWSLGPTCLSLRTGLAVGGGEMAGCLDKHPSNAETDHLILG